MRTVIWKKHVGGFMGHVQPGDEVGLPDEAADALEKMGYVESKPVEKADWELQLEAEEAEAKAEVARQNKAQWQGENKSEGDNA